MKGTACTLNVAHTVYCYDVYEKNQEKYFGSSVLVVKKIASKRNV